MHPAQYTKQFCFVNPLLCLSHWSQIHWNENVVILMKSSSLAALKVVILTTIGAASDEDFIKMTTFSFQCYLDRKDID